MKGKAVVMRGGGYECAVDDVGGEGADDVRVGVAGGGGQDGAADHFNQILVLRRVAVRVHVFPPRHVFKLRKAALDAEALDDGDALKEEVAFGGRKIPERWMGFKTETRC